MDEPEANSEARQLLLWQRRLTVAVLSLLLFFLIFQIGAYFADILRILAISILLSYLFINVVDYLTRYLKSRAAAIVIVYAFLVAATIFSAVLLIPSMIYQVGQLVQGIWDHLPDVIRFINKTLAPVQARLEAADIQIRTTDIMSSLAASIPKPDPSFLVNKLTDITMSTMTWVVYAISILVTSFYFLLEGRRLTDSVVSLFPARYRFSLKQISVEMDHSLQSFFRGQVVLALLAGLVMLGVYMALGVNYALLLSVFLAFWEIVPVIGPPIGFIPTIIAVAMDGSYIPGNKLVQVIVITIIFQVLQQLKDNVLAPRYIGNVIGVHPILIFVAIMVGAKLDGLLGIIFALPAACVLNVFLSHLPLKANDAAAQDSVVNATILEDTAEAGAALPPGEPTS